MENVHPQTGIIDGFYNPADYNGAVKMPLHHTSTYTFESAEQAAAFFEISQGKRAPEPGVGGFIYSRLNTPNLQLAENRLTIYDGAEMGLLFESGMAAISATCLALLQPGDIIVHTEPLYGGTDHFFRDMLAHWGVRLMGFGPGETFEQIADRLDKNGEYERMAMVYVETPSNPLNTLIDFEVVQQVRNHIHSQGGAAVVVADNTYLGPIFQQPLKHGADVVVYSCTKYIGGHSDLLAGAALGSKSILQKIKKVRNSLGNMAGPHTAWLLTRSLETLELRMRAAEANARALLGFFEKQHAVETIHYPGYKRQTDIYQKQCSGSGATIGIEIRGGQEAAFRFLNALKLVRLAVSLGGTESLATHPATTTHSNVPENVRAHYGIHDNLVRLSIGIEHESDLLADLEHALKKSQQYA
ncbi:MAG: methionine gamma-lyase [Sphingobacteriaceae bacterium]|nr:methionine gamma-lyase [Sphingobacteriaceae bacterium]